MVVFSSPKFALSALAAAVLTLRAQPLRFWTPRRPPPPRKSRWTQQPLPPREDGDRDFDFEFE